MSENSSVPSLVFLPLRCAGTARLLALPDHSHSTQSTGYQPYAGEMDTQSVTGETLSWSPSTGPFTDDSACGLTKQEPEGKPTGGNAVGVPAASCPIDLNAVPPASGKHSKERPLFSSSSDEEMEVRGKGVGRRAPLPAPTTRKATRTPALRRTLSPPKRERSPRRPTTPEQELDDEKEVIKYEEKVQERAPSPARERSPRRDSKLRDEKRDSSQGSSGKDSRAKTIFYDVGTPHESPPRSLSRGAIPREPHGSTSIRTPEARKPPPSPRATE